MTCGLRFGEGDELLWTDVQFALRMFGQGADELLQLHGLELRRDGSGQVVAATSSFGLPYVVARVREDGECL